MKKNNLFALALAATTVLGAFAATSSVMADESQNSGSTTVTFTKETPDPTYTLTVPATITGTQAGFTKAAGQISVKSEKFGTNGYVSVKIQADNKLIGTNKKNELSYDVRRNAEASDKLTEIRFLPAGQTNNSTDSLVYSSINSGADFGINIADANWNAAPDDTYTGTINFVATYTKSAQ